MPARPAPDVAAPGAARSSTLTSAPDWATRYAIAAPIAPAPITTTCPPRTSFRWVSVTEAHRDHQCEDHQEEAVPQRGADAATEPARPDGQHHERPDREGRQPGAAVGGV